MVCGHTSLLPPSAHILMEPLPKPGCAEHHREERHHSVPREPGKQHDRSSVKDLKSDLRNLSMESHSPTMSRCDFVGRGL